MLILPNITRVYNYNNIIHSTYTNDTIVCSRSVGRGLRAEVYVMVECSYFVYT